MHQLGFRTLLFTRVKKRLPLIHITLTENNVALPVLDHRALHKFLYFSNKPVLILASLINN